MEMKQNVVDEKLNKYKGQVDGFVEKILGLVGDHPWQEWLAKANDVIERYIPAVIALMGILACMTGVVTMIKIDAPFSMVMSQFWIILPTLFAMHLAPKAMGLVRSLVEKNESLAIRPEFLYIMKVSYGLGGLLLGVYFILQFNAGLMVVGIVSIIFAVLMIISFNRPEIVAIKADYPTNCVEEVIALILLPVRILLALVTLIIGIGCVGGVVYGVTLLFSEEVLGCALVFSFTAVLPLVLPLAIYGIYLAVVFWLDFYRAIVSIPRKIEELKK